MAKDKKKRKKKGKTIGKEEHRQCEKVQLVSYENPIDLLCKTLKNVSAKDIRLDFSEIRTNEAVKNPIIYQMADD